MASAAHPTFLSSSERPHAVFALQTNLRQMGFAEERFLADPSLFALPDPVAFQQIVYFLLGVCDPLGTAADFRDVWPIVEKKQEAEFRRKVSASYKAIQTCSNNRLPFVNPSLFMDPRGRKMINFLHEFSRHALRGQIQRMKSVLKDSSVMLEPPSFAPLADYELASSAYRAPAVSGLAEAAETERKAAGDRANAEALVAEMAQDYRTLKAESDVLDNKLRELLERAAAEVLPGVATVEDLKAESFRVKEKYEALAAQLQPFLTSICHSLEIVTTATRAESNTLELDLTEAAMTANSSSAAETIERLISTALNGPLSLTEEILKAKSYPLEALEKRNRRIAKHNTIMEAKRMRLKQEVLPQLLESIKKLEEQAFVKVTVNEAERESISLSLPANPLKLDFDRDVSDASSMRFFVFSEKRKDLAKDKVPQIVASFVAKELHPVSSTFARSADLVQTSSSFLDATVSTLSLGTSRSDLLTGHAAKGNASDDCEFTRPAHMSFMHSTRMLLRQRMGGGGRDSSEYHRLAAMDDSKVSVFSPVLSSSRMELSVMHAATATAAATSYSSGDLGPSGGGRFKPICLSPSVVESRSDLGLASQSFSPLRGSPGARDSGQKITTRMNDLMSTLMSNGGEEDSIGELSVLSELDLNRSYNMT